MLIIVDFWHALAATEDLELNHIVVNITFLHSYLKHDVCVEGSLWIEMDVKDVLIKFDTFMKSQYFSRSEVDHCGYYNRFNNGSYIMILSSVDHILVAILNIEKIIDLKAQLGWEIWNEWLRSKKPNSMANDTNE